MGRSIIRKFVGAYFKIDMPNKQFRKKLDDLEFHNNFSCDIDDQPKFKHFFFENFVSAEGLESMPILLPFDKDENKKIGIDFADFDEEFEFDVSEIDVSEIDFKTLVENLKETYADEIKDMQEIFGDKFKIKTGLVDYRDEIA